MAKSNQELLDKLGSYVKELYGKSEDLAYLIQLGWIVFPGREYNVENGMQPLDVVKALQSGKDVYFQHVPDKTAKGETSCSISLIDDELKMVPCTKDLIDGKVRDAALKELDKDDLIIGYKFVSLGKMTDFIKKGDDPTTAYEKACGQYGRVADAVKIIDPRTDEEIK